MHTKPPADRDARGERQSCAAVAELEPRGLVQRRATAFGAGFFQARFKSIPVDGEGSWALTCSDYIHLSDWGRDLDLAPTQNV